jgi:putative RNA 2'-phosphotransferase
MTSSERRQLSKFLSLMLRHQAVKFGLRLDEEGFTPLADLVAAARRERGWQHVTEEAVREVVATSDKQRFELRGEQIRARYGHSVPGQVSYPEAEPPELLYHGTSPAALPSIRARGLQSMRRQYVHLSTAVEQARTVGRRHAADPVILTVRARAAWEAGITFHQPEARLWLASSIPPEYIEERKGD